ncbi:MAG: hypothetical protein MRK00_02135 [Nitrosomonas sp.]|nr:hypothetical protein [Nitrosomonas sp.]
MLNIEFLRLPFSILNYRETDFPELAFNPPEWLFNLTGIRSMTKILIRPFFDQPLENVCIIIFTCQSACKTYQNFG